MTKSVFFTALLLAFAVVQTSANTLVRLDVSASKVTQFDIMRDDFKLARGKNKRLAELPEFSADIVISSKGIVIPAKRGLRDTDNRYWSLILEVGRWYKTDDKFSLALPFALVEKDGNCTHQGMLAIENNTLAYQISTETCQYFKFNAQGYATTALMNPRSEGADSLVDNLSLELSNHLPEKPLSALPADNPGLTAEAFAQADFIEPTNMSLYGLVKDGVHYVSDCETRAVAYSDCGKMPLPSYSLAKSMIGALGLMRLEKLYPGTQHRRVKDLIPDCNDWGEVTLSHLLNTSTGRYGSALNHRDEEQHIGKLLAKPSAASKTKFACNLYKAKSEPGEKWVYHTSDTWLLGVAMQSLWQQKKGPTADFYTDLINPIWHDLGLSPVIQSPHRQDGQPLTGLGLSFLRSDIALFAQAMASGHSALYETLDKDMLDAAMQRNPSDRGSVAGSPELRYKNGFWGWDAGGYLNCEQPKWIPSMSGYGGIAVVFLEDGDSYYYFSDGGVHRFADVIKHLHNYKKLC